MYLASAMCTLQSKGVVHRDLKPQNLLLHHSGTTTPSPSQIKIKIGKFFTSVQFLDLIFSCSQSSLFLRLCGACSTQATWDNFFWVPLTLCLLINYSYY